MPLIHQPTQVNTTIDHAATLLHDALGWDENMVLLTEVNAPASMDLWLLVMRAPKGVVFVVTDGPIGRYKEHHEFNAVDQAVAYYRKVRSAGSWNDHRNENRRA